jgi:hypothetical protein
MNNKTYTPKQAAVQIKKMNKTIADIEDKMRPEYGNDWHKNISYNQTLNKKINSLYDKIKTYIPFLNEETYDEILASDMCCSYHDFIG